MDFVLYLTSIELLPLVVIPQSSALKTIEIEKYSSELYDFDFFSFLIDLDRITPFGRDPAKLRFENN